MNQNKAKNYFHVVVSATNHIFLKILTMKAEDKSGKINRERS